MPEFGESDLLAALSPIKSYLDDIVVCGGWTLLIYRKWVLKDGGPLPMATLDLDLAVPPRVDVIERPVDELLTAAGYHVEYMGMDEPAVIYMKAGSPDIEFLTPRKGNRPPKPVTVQPGLQAEPLRFIEIVLDNTRRVDIPEAGLRVRVPTPEAYLYQKGLSFPRRNREEKKAKDLAYIFELLHNFPSLAKDLVNALPALCDRYPQKWFSTFRSNLEQFFSGEDAEGVKMVARQKPHPHDEMIRRDPTNGPGLFRRLIFTTLRDFMRSIA